MSRQFKGKQQGELADSAAEIFARNLRANRTQN
jgi:hypothetical protein